MVYWFDLVEWDCRIIVGIMNCYWCVWCVMCCFSDINLLMCKFSFVFEWWFYVDYMVLLCVWKCYSGVNSLLYIIDNYYDDYVWC